MSGTILMRNPPLLSTLIYNEIPALESAAISFSLPGMLILNMNLPATDNQTFELLHYYPETAQKFTTSYNLDVLINKIAASHKSITTGNGPSGLFLDHLVPISQEIPAVFALGAVLAESESGLVGCIYFKESDIFSETEKSCLQSFVELAAGSVRLRAAAELFKSEKAKYSHLFSAAPEAIAMLDEHNRIIEVNPEFEKLFQYKKDEIVGLSLDELIAPIGKMDEAKHLSYENWEGRKVFIETTRKRRDGKLLNVSILGVPFDHGDGHLRIFGIYRDITENIKAIEKRQNRLAFIENLGRLSSELINTDIKNIDALIEQALQMVGKSHSAERAYLAKINHEKSAIEITHEWVDDKRYSYIENQPNILISEVGDYLEFLKAGVTFNLSRNEVGKVKGTSGLEFFFDLLSIESLVNIPLFVDRVFWGYIGFDTYSRTVEWDKQSVDSLRLTGQILINAQSRKKTEEVLNDALEQVKSSDNLKSAFLAGISHEIRTPMNHILGFVDLLSEPDISASEKADFVKIMKSSGMNLLHLIDDVIELAMIDSGQVKICEEQCDLNRFMQSLLVEANTLKSDLQRNEVRLIVNGDSGLNSPVILTDEQKVRQLIKNLVSNALKYTLKGSVEMGFSILDNNRIEFYIKDTGIGIRPEDQGIIFDRFHRLNNGFSRSFGGAGLGLCISQGLARLFGSEISITSAPGTGSTFKFNIPYKPYLAPHSAAIPASIGSIIYNWSGKNILMVEDDPVNMRFLAVLLLKTNAHLLYAADGEEAVEMVQKNPVDIVLMDMNLPVMNGYEATRRIRSLMPDLPVIAQTAHALSGDRKECLEAGCNEYLAKPIDKNLLYSMIEMFLKTGKS